MAEITSRDTYVNNKPVIGGLCDPRMGVQDPGFICPSDGLDHIQTPGYFGHIELAKPIFYIQYLSTIMKILRCVCIKCSNNRLAVSLPVRKKNSKSSRSLGLLHVWFHLPNRYSALLCVCYSQWLEAWQRSTGMGSLICVIDYDADVPQRSMCLQHLCSVSKSG